MAEVHVQSPDGAQNQYSEYRFELELQAGNIKPGSMYWQEGMQAWRPVSLYITPKQNADTAVPATAIQNLQTSSSTKYRTRRDGYASNPVGLTYLVLLMLFICLILQLLRVWSSWQQLNLLTTEITEAVARANNTRQLLILLIYMGVFVLTAMSFLMWVYIANLNSRGFGAKGMNYSPGWSVGWFFVPLMNWIKPYLVMREIYQVSKHPEEWRSQSGSTLMALWWVLWLVYNAWALLVAYRVLNYLIYGMPKFTRDDLVVITQIDIGANVVAAIMTFLLISIVKEISDRHRDLAAYYARNKTPAVLNTPQNPFEGLS